MDNELSPRKSRRSWRPQSLLTHLNKKVPRLCTLGRYSRGPPVRSQMAVGLTGEGTDVKAKRADGVEAAHAFLHDGLVQLGLINLYFIVKVIIIPLLSRHAILRSKFPNLLAAGRAFVAAHAVGVTDPGRRAKVRPARRPSRERCRRGVQRHVRDSRNAGRPGGCFGR